MSGKLVEERSKFFRDNNGYDYILQEYHDDTMSEFVVSQGGDVNTFRVYGKSPEDFYIVCR